MGHIYPVLLSGGAGTRLWPLSRAMYPKQFIRALAGQGPCLLAATLQRTAAEPDFARPIIVCNSDHRFLVEEEAALAGVKPRAIVLEPVARNTAPAIAAAAVLVEAEDADGILLVMPSDHVITDRDPFLAAVRGAAEVAAKGKLVLFGIKPTAPHTGYGYIRRGAPLPGFDNVFAVDAFTEKPNAETAAHYLAAGNYAWNSGIFVLSVGAFLAELSRLAPGLLEAVRASIGAATTDLGFLRLEDAAFARAPQKSFDYAVMEKTDRAAVVEGHFRWSDIGSWDAIFQLADRDARGNALHGPVVAADADNCVVHAEDRLVAVLGVKDLVVVATTDAVLVIPRERAQEVRELVLKLKQGGRPEATDHRRVHRPWGYYDSLDAGERFQVKRIVVRQGGTLSLQKHMHRAEHWVVVRGTAEVTIGEERRLVHENESIYVPIGAVHRLANHGKIPLELIEVQSGSYLGEDDIVRLDDVYRR